MRVPFSLIAVLCIALAHTAMTQDTQLTNREPGVYTLADLFSRADKVVLANVVAGDTASYDIPMYKAEVVAAFKGATNGETIFFGPYIGIRVGTQYFLFLENAPEPIAPKAKSSAGFGTVQYAQVFNEGYTSMQASRQCIFPGNEPAQQCANAVRVCTSYITLPKSLETFSEKAADPSPGCRWVRQDAFTTALSDLIRPTP
jgi:hypothetical protein